MRRSLRIARLGVRAASTATATKVCMFSHSDTTISHVPQHVPKPKWQANVYNAPSVTIPQSRSWGRPPDPSSSSSQSQSQSQANIPQKRSWARPAEHPAPTSSGFKDLPESIRARASRDRQQRVQPLAKNGPSSSGKGKQSEQSSLQGLGNILRSDRIQKASKALAEGEGEQKVTETEGQKGGSSALARVWTPSPDADDGSASRSRSKRSQFKERGSLVSRLAGEVEIPAYSRVSVIRPAGKEKEKLEKAPKLVKQVNVDVYIPSVVSVGNLAKLLNVKLGKSSTVHRRWDFDAELELFETRCVER